MYAFRHVLAQWPAQVRVARRSGRIDTEAVASVAGLASDGDTRWTSTRSVLGTGEDHLARLSSEAARAREQFDGSDAVCSLGAVQLGPPVPDPSKIICIGLNYHDHVEEAGVSTPDTPVVLPSFQTLLSVLGQQSFSLM